MEQIGELTDYQIVHLYGRSDDVEGIPTELTHPVDEHEAAVQLGTLFGLTPEASRAYLEKRKASIDVKATDQSV